ncbi:MFS transporter [Corynebacterium glyciniphilum]|uniref:MFS transporter n=1 Tax=Corynebacterium glyciniphilum TaxID=1404244 RepID=UPI003DA128FD
MPRPAAFATASVALITIFLSSGVPVPLYNTYRVENGITDADLALTTVIYLGSTALSLLVFGRLSDHIGRRPMVLTAVAFSVAGCLVLMQVQGVGLLIVGRVLQGFACGTASSAAGALVIDLAPARRLRWLPAVIASSAPPFAIPVGALMSGALAEYAPAPRIFGYAVVAVLLVVCGALLLACPETVKRAPGALQSLIPRVHIPAGAGRALLTAGATLVATWSFSGFYQAFSPGLTADYLGTSNALMVAVVFASIIVLAPLGGTLTGQWQPRIAVRAGLILFVVGVVTAVAMLHAAAIVPFLIASAVAGVAQGAANGAGMRGVFVHVPSADRAGTLATLYLISYSGGAVPGLIAGQLSNSVPLPDVGAGYAGLVIVAAVVALVASRVPRQER